MKVKNNLTPILETIPNDVTLVAATKYIDANEMKKLLKYGINNFGENKIDSFLEKYEQLNSENIIWHFIGHLQSNKAKKIINYLDYLHSLDSLKLAEQIEKYRHLPLNCFLEISINNELQKNGIPLSQVSDFINKVLSYKKIKVIGLMMMSKKNSSPKELNEQFFNLVTLRDKLEKDFNIKLPYLSMGMSDDYLFAIKNKSTHVRLGRILYIDND